MVYKILESRQILIKRHHIIDSSGTRGVANTFVPVVYISVGRGVSLKRRSRHV
jgi:hypothetical protein